MITIKRFNNNRITCQGNYLTNMEDAENRLLINKLTDERLKITKLQFYEDNDIHYTWSDSDFELQTLEFRYSDLFNVWVFGIINKTISFYSLDSISFSDGSAFKFIKDKDRIRLYSNTNNLRSINSILC